MAKKDFIPDKSLFKDPLGRYITQSLFLEFNYEKKFAVYSLKDDDFDYEGKFYPSLKRLYLMCADPTEYQFAMKYLYDWKHWQRLCDNKQIMREIADWREELQVSLQSAALIAMADMTENFQAQKFLAERGWEKNRVGRPNKVDPLKDEKIQDKIADELKDTLSRMDKYKVA